MGVLSPWHSPTDLFVGKRLVQFLCSGNHQKGRKRVILFPPLISHALVGNSWTKPMSSTSCRHQVPLPMMLQLILFKTHTNMLPLWAFPQGNHFPFQLFLLRLFKLFKWETENSCQFGNQKILQPLDRIMGKTKKGRCSCIKSKDKKAKTANKG